MKPGFARFFLWDKDDAGFPGGSHCVSMSLELSGVWAGGELGITNLRVVGVKADVS
jgi:hypothetical protein